MERGRGKGECREEEERVSGERKRKEEHGGEWGLTSYRGEKQ